MPRSTLISAIDVKREPLPPKAAGCWRRHAKLGPVPLRVCIVAPLVSPVRADAAPLGGAQSYLADLAHWLARQGHSVVLLGARGSSVEGVQTPDLGLDAETLQPARFDG